MQAYRCANQGQKHTKEEAGKNAKLPPPNNNMVDVLRRSWPCAGQDRTPKFGTRRGDRPLIHSQNLTNPGGHQGALECLGSRAYPPSTVLKFSLVTKCPCFSFSATVGGGGQRRAVAAAVVHLQAEVGEQLLPLGGVEAVRGPLGEVQRDIRRLGSQQRVRPGAPANTQPIR